MTVDELIATACPKVRDLGWAFYFVPETAAKGQELGLDLFQFYFLGRGGVLGDVDPAVVTSAFGYFNPALVEQLWNAGRQQADPRKAALAFTDAAADFGRARFADVDGLDAFCTAADTVVGAADPAGLTVFAGAIGQPRADDAPARAMQLLALLRELRGSAHLAAVRSTGLDARTAHFIKRPADAAMFGWSADDAPEITDEDRARHERAEAVTDGMVRPAYGALDAPGRAALAAGVDAIEAALSA